MRLAYGASMVLLMLIGVLLVLGGLIAVVFVPATDDDTKRR